MLTEFLKEGCHFKASSLLRGKYVYFYLIVIALAVLYQYFPLLYIDFPAEPETLAFFTVLKVTPWYKLPLFNFYYSIFPILNLIQKFCAILFFANKPVLFGVIIIFHLLNISMVFLIAKALTQYFISTQTMSVSKESDLCGILAAAIFATFNSYYFYLANPAVMFGFGVVYFIILLYIFFILNILKSDRKKTFLYIACILMAGILPFIFLISITFLVITFILFIFIDSNKEQKVRLIVPILGAHLVALFIEILFLDARFSKISLATRTTMWSPNSFGLLHNLVSDPITFLMMTFHTAFSGIQFGLIYQNFLFSTPSYSFSYLIGFLIFVIYIVFAFCNSRTYKINIILWLLIFINLINVCIMRNPLSGEGGRIFDAYYVASQSRYYYFPAVLLSFSLAITLSSLIDAFYKKKILFWLLIVLTISFMLYNMNYSREKIDFLKKHMASEIYRYTPKSLRPPIADPANPSFIKIK